MLINSSQPGYSLLYCCYCIILSPDSLRREGRVTRNVSKIMQSHLRRTSCDRVRLKTRTETTTVAKLLFRFEWRLLEAFFVPLSLSLSRVSSHDNFIRVSALVRRTTAIKFDLISRISRRSGRQYRLWPPLAEPALAIFRASRTRRPQAPTAVYSQIRRKHWNCIYRSLCR